MPVKHRRTRPRRFVIRFPKIQKRFFLKLLLLLLLLGAVFFGVRLNTYLRELSEAMALSDSEDMVVSAVNDAVIDMMAKGDYDYDYFVSLGKNEQGNVVSLDANMSRVNAFSAELLSQVAELSQETIEVHIPVGNLVGSSLLLGKGPDIVVHMIMLTSAHVEFRSELATAGINQTEHRLLLNVVVDIDVLVPWGRASTQTVTEVIIAETVIVGNVPNMYVNTTEDSNGYQTGT